MLTTPKKEGRVLRWKLFAYVSHTVGVPTKEGSTLLESDCQQSNVAFVAAADANSDGSSKHLMGEAVERYKCLPGQTLNYKWGSCEDHFDSIR